MRLQKIRHDYKHKLQVNPISIFYTKQSSKQKHTQYAHMLTFLENSAFQNASASSNFNPAR